jgi:hypothetical protein
LVLLHKGSATTTLNGGIVAADTTITLTDASSFPTTGTVLIGNFSSGNYASTSELVTYSGKAGNDLTGCTRSTNGTTAPSSTATGTTVTNATDWTGFGSAVKASTVTLEPGLWSLNSFGEVLVATILNGKTFTWNAGGANATGVRASTTTSGFETTNNPTATRTTLISPTTRHLIHFGTEITIGTPATQDDMFIRFSADELVAKENILVWTDNALYTMKFVGAPFTFGFEQVGTNCGLIGQNAAIEIDGVAYWMSNNGFFSFDGTVNSLPCSVEDYVYDDIDTTKGQQIAAGINNLFTEVTWWYPTSSSNFNNRSVIYNYGAKAPPGEMGNWYSNTNTNFNRTTWIDSLVYPKPYSTSYNTSNTGTFPVIIGETGLGQSVFFEHEIGTDQINPDGSTTALLSFIQSYNFALQTDQGIGEYFLAMRRFLPNFKVLTGNNQVTISVSDYPSEDAVATTLSPFTITSSTTKVDTRARGRYANVKMHR